MDYELVNNGEPNEEGDIVAVIKTGDGKRVSTFKAKTESDLIKQLLTSQVHANSEIARLRKPDAARPTLKVEPKNLSPADRLRLASDITDPTKVVEAVEEIVTARQGISPDRVGAEFARQSQEEQDAFYGAQADAFRQDCPTYYPVPQNRDKLFDELRANGWDLTRNNLAIAFATLTERGEMIPWPTDLQTSQRTEESEHQPVSTNGNGITPNGQSAPNPPNSPRPRTIAATGLRNSDASGTPPPPQPRKQKYTRADIERMPRHEFVERLQSDPDFRKAVDAM